jgi:hypothetical protein
MTPADHLLSQVNAHDAFYDQIERELRALTIARLDGIEGAPRQAVDEFADGQPLRLPPRHRQERGRM